MGLIIIVGVLSLIVLFEIITFSVYGWFIPKEIEVSFMDLDESKLRLNMFDSSILSTTPYITKLPVSIFSQYYIEGLGVVPRWSKLHKKINQYYAIAIKNGNK